MVILPNLLINFFFVFIICYLWVFCLQAFYTVARRNVIVQLLVQQWNVLVSWLSRPSIREDHNIPISTSDFPMPTSQSVRTVTMLNLHFILGHIITFITLNIPNPHPLAHSLISIWLEPGRDPDHSSSTLPTNIAHSRLPDRRHNLSPFGPKTTSFLSCEIPDAEV